MSQEHLMTVREVADRLQLGVPTVREMIGRGEIPAAKIGKEYRIERADLENFIESRKTSRETS